MENIDDSEMDSYDKEVNMYLNEHNNENQDNELENYGTIKEDQEENYLEMKYEKIKSKVNMLKEENIVNENRITSIEHENGSKIDQIQSFMSEITELRKRLQEEKQKQAKYRKNNPLSLILSESDRNNDSHISSQSHRSNERKNLNKDSNNLNDNSEYLAHHLQHNHSNNDINDKSILKEDNIDLMEKITNQFNRDNNPDYIDQEKLKQDMPSQEFSNNDIIELIYKELLEILTEYHQKTREYLNDNPFNEEANDLTTMYYKSCAFIYVESVNSEVLFKFQTFRIVGTMKLEHLKVEALKFWGVGNDIFSLKYFFLAGREEMLDINSSTYDEMILEKFLKINTNVRQAVFICYSNKANINHTEVLEKYDLMSKQHQMETKQKDLITKEVERFFKVFTGQASYLSNKYLDIKQEEVLKDKEESDDKKNNFSILKLICSIHVFLPFLFLVFLIFSIVSVVILRPQNSCYYKTLSAVNLLKSNANLSYFQKKAFITLEEYIDITTNMFLPFIDRSEEGIASKLNETTYIATSLRMGFYSVEKTKCEDAYYSYNPDYSCYPLLWSESVASSGMENNYLISTTNFNSEYSKQMVDTTNILDYYFIKSDSSDAANQNHLSLGVPSTLLNLYYSNVFRNMISPNEFDSNISFSAIGRLGEYTGSGNSVHISLPYVNGNVFKTLLAILQKDPNLFYSRSLRGSTMTMTYFQYPDKFFYYIKVLFEFTPYGKILYPTIEVIPFKPNIFFDDSGKTLMVLDILRLLIIIFIMFLSFRYFSERLKYKNSHHKSTNNVIIALFEPHFSLVIISFILYIIVFIKKFTSLNENLDNIFGSYSGYAYKELQMKDYASTAYSFEVVLMLETLIIFFIISRLCLVFSNLSRFKVIFEYLKISVLNSVTFVGIFAMIIISFAIFANNLFGFENNYFRDFGSSLISLLLVTIGHFNLVLSDSNQINNWKNFFLTIYVIVIVYLFLSTFIGIFLDSFRIAISREKSSYSSRLLNDLDKSVKIEEKL